jgi:DNA replication protein DnaC
MKRNRDVDLMRLKEHLKALRLPTIQAECVKLAQECLTEGVDHLGFLLKVCELELIERERKAAARRLKAAALPGVKLISEFDFTAQPAINRLLVLDLMRCEYIEKRENVLLIGTSGTGKTHIATSLAMEACSQGKRVRFYRVTELVTQLLEAREERQLSRIRSQLSKLDLLVLDELGYVPMGKAGAELLFDVMSRAYERMSLIVTTNLPFENWTEVLDNERLTGATLDRLTHRCHIVETGGESYRLKDARRRRGSREVYKAEATGTNGPEQTLVNTERPGA